MPAHTLAQAIDNLAAIRPQANVTLQALIDDLTDARRKLDGLEELRALTDARSHAYERATDLTKRFEGKWTATHERVLEVAQFLAPGWQELERPEPDGLEDDFGPTLTTTALTAKLTLAEEAIEALEADKAIALDRIRDLIADLDAITLLAARRATALDRIRTLAQDVDAVDELAARAAIIEIERIIKDLAQ